MACRWERAPDGLRYWLPDCMGGAVYGIDGCTCDRKKEKEKDLLYRKFEELERRVRKLENALAKKLQEEV